MREQHPGEKWEYGNVVDAAIRVMEGARPCEHTRTTGHLDRLTVWKTCDDCDAVIEEPRTIKPVPES
jgi:hypothetical protein